MSDEQFIQKGPVLPVKEDLGPLGKFLLDRLRGHTDKTLLIDGVTEEAVSRAQLLERSVSVALELRERGVKPGDHVTVSVENGLDSVYAILGVLYVGGVCAPMNPNLHIPDIRHLVQLVEPKLVLCAPHAAENFRAALPASTPVVPIQRGQAEWDGFVGRKDAAGAVAAFQANGAGNPEDTVCIIPSSGTTGPPKGVMLCHRNWHVFLQLMDLTINNMPPEAKAKQVVLQVTNNYWLSGFFTIIVNVAAGIPIIIYPRFQVDPILAGIQKYKVTSIVLAPQYVSAIAKHPDVEKYDVSTLELLGFSGAALSPDLQTLAANRLNTFITRFYAQTESLLVVLPGPKSPQKPSTIGVPALNVALKIIDTVTGKTLGPNQEGELCLKSRMVFTGYYKNPEITKETIDEDGWVHTGDAGYYDEDGYFYIVDRYKALIKSKGFHILPAEVEDIITSLDGVVDAAVVGVPHDEDQEHPVGFVVVKEGHHVTKEDIFKLLKERLPPYKQLHGGIHFIKEIPRSAAAKIQRRELRQLARTLRFESNNKIR